MLLHSLCQRIPQKKGVLQLPPTLRSQQWKHSKEVLGSKPKSPLSAKKTKQMISIQVAPLEGIRLSREKLYQMGGHHVPQGN